MSGEVRERRSQENIFTPSRVLNFRISPFLAPVLNSLSKVQFDNVNESGGETFSPSCVLSDFKTF